MENKKIKLGILFLFSILVTSMIGGVFAAPNCNGADKGSLSCLLTSENLTDFFANMQWMNWVIYIALIFIIGNVLTQILGGSKSAKMGSYLISFMGITGFMWVLMANSIFPIHLMLWVAEIFVLIFAGALIKVSFNLSKNKKGFLGQTKWIGLFFGFIIINQFNGMLIKFATIQQNGVNLLSVDSTLYQIANTLNLVDLPIAGLLFLLIIWLAIAIFGETKMARDKVAGPLTGYVNELRDSNAKHQTRMKIVGEIKDLYNQLRGIK